jgi:Asp-tRNA(Asn)/Glu-tRNA(Gln) amidotransferase A subunit family amidase
MDGRWGVVSFADSLDCVGVLGKSVDTVKTVFGEHDSNVRERLS